MQFLLHFPETNGTDRDMLDAGDVASVAVRAEQAGFNGLAFSEHPMPGARWLEAGGHQSLDPFVALGAAASVTTTLRLMTNLTVVPYRNPFMLAKSAATVDKLSNGRMTLGLGTGYMKSEYFALGVDFEERNALFDEALEVLPLHWKGEPFSYEGLHFSARDVIARPRPVQDPIPMWIGGNSALSRRRVVKHAQGWMPMLGSSQLATTARTKHIETYDELADMIAELHQQVADSGRTDRIEIQSSYQGGMPVGSDPEAHLAKIAEAEKIGIDWMVISCFTRTQDETFAFLDWFGEAILSS